MNTPQIGYLSLPLDTPKPQNFFEKLLQALDGQMTEPTPFGLFHLFFLALTVGLCIFAVHKCRNISDKSLRTVLIATSATLIAFEIYKQFNVAYNWEEDTWGYDWGAFPFQFCSTPLYVMPLAALVKGEKLRSRLYTFLGTYCFVAGTIVMLLPTTVFTETIGLNIQTMIHHGAMIVIAVLLLASNKIELNRKTLKTAIPVFLVLCAMALIMNGLFIAFGDSEQNFNMFYISPTEDPPMDILVTLLDYIPYPVYLLGYIFFFTLGAYLVLLFAEKLHERHEKRMTHTAEERAEEQQKQTLEQTKL
ncbi:MAG: YwaF family protein [Clostridia bacterium]|nr:YwaF family protein [Clostridia bacterium]